MKKIALLLFIIFSILSCKEYKNDTESEITNSITVEKSQNNLSSNCPPYLLKEKDNNLNISIFLDLSDRIEEPTMIENDLAYLSSISKSFTNHIKTKKLVMLNDKMQLFFNPNPSDKKINEIAGKLKIHFTRDTPEKMINETIKIYSTEPSGLYEIARLDANENKKNYPGADIWRFFKDDVKDYAIDDCYRNILIVITDGYMFYDKTVMKEGNRTSYLTPKSLAQLSLNKSNWKEIIETKNIGFIPALTELNNLEVLVIGINSLNDNNPYTLNIIETYWSKWFIEMGIAEEYFKIKNADIPSNMEKVINDFIKK